MTTTSEGERSVSRTLDERRWALEALASLGDGVVIVDDRSRLVYTNPAATRLVGDKYLSAANTEWSLGYDTYLADEQTPYPGGQLPLLRALRGEAVVDAELFVKNDAVPNGIHLLVNACPLRDATGEPRGAVCIFHDLTLRRQERALLFENERQRKAILDNIPDIAWLKDREGRFIAVNQRFATSAGKPAPGDVVGLTDLDLWPQELAERYRAGDDEVIRTKQPSRSEEPFVDASGKVAWIETVKEVVVGDGGEVLGTTGIARDITQRKRAEEALRVTNDELERRVRLRTSELAEAQENLVRKERLAVLGQLAGGVAHQIRNPLAAIMNATYVLRRHVGPNQHPNVEDAIRIIHDEVRHANVIITGLLDFARVRTPDRHPASVVELIDRALADDLVPSNVAIKKTVADVPLLDVDADQLYGAFVNLVRNAVEAMPTGGTLCVEVELEAGFVMIAVADTGAGISPSVSGHLFEPLHSTKPQGIGLGLVTARTFIEAHGGRISRAESSVGARFEIRLPLPAR